MTSAVPHPDAVAAVLRRGAARPDVDERALRERAARVIWSCLIEPGDGTAGALIDARGPVGALELVAGLVRDLAAGGLHVEPELTRALERWQPRMDLALVTAAVEQAARRGIRILTPDDALWPHALDDLGEHTPPCLWVRGDPAALGCGEPARPTRRSVALVGARAATAYGEHAAGELAAGLARESVSVVSGAAYGIDGAAHRAVLAAGGTTVAFLAGGCDRPYPAGHTDLIAQIARTGAVVSEVPCGSAPTKWRFLQRNRLIAACADATVVVEAGLRSGSLNTAGHAATLGRPLGAVPGPITSAASAGAHRLLREFDATCVTSTEEVLELIGVTCRAAARQTEGRPTDDRTRVRDALSARVARSIDEIAARSGMAVSDVKACLGVLLLGGEVEAAGEGWRRRG